VFVNDTLDLVTEYPAVVRRQNIAKKWLPNPWLLTIWDDCTADKYIFNKTIVQATYKYGRHWKMMHLLCLQAPLDIPPSVRDVLDCTFIMYSPNRENRTKLFKHFCHNSIKHFVEFDQIMDQVAENFCALVIMNNKQTNNINEVVYYYNVSKPPNDGWKLGAPEVHDFHNTVYDPNYADRMPLGM
jgi:hypothetical protein